MGPRALLLWSAAAVVSTVGAVYVTVEGRGDVTEAARLEEPVFPALRAAPETAAAITVAHGGATIRVERHETGWQAPEVHGYAVDEAAVRDLLTGLADLRYAAPRTALPERFPRLEVGEPGGGSDAKRVTVNASDGDVLVDAIIGKRSHAITGSDRGTYLRLPDGERAWLAAGTVDVATDPLDWLATDLPSIARDDLELLVVRPAEGEGFTVGRTTPGEDMTLTDDVPEGRTTNANQIRRLAGVFADLRFEEVRPAPEVTWPETVTTVTGTSFADETLVLEMATLDDDARWVRFETIDGWVYRLPDFQLDRLDKRLADLLSEPEAS